MEGLGKKLQDARFARNLTLDEAARFTKIRPSRLEDLENQDFSQFASLAYAKGFLVIYSKFLGVDIAPYLEMFETSGEVTVDGYSYLQENPAPKPTRPVVVRKQGSGRRSSLVPFLIGVVVLVAGFTVMKMILDIQRIKPTGSRAATAASSPIPTATVENIVAPRALPVENATAPSASAVAEATTTPAPAIQPTIAAVAPTSSPAPTEPEVRRAEPVHPEDLLKPNAPGDGVIHRVDIRALRKTFVKVVVDNAEEKPAFARWITPADGLLQFRGKHVSVNVLDNAAVEIRKNGKRIYDGDDDVTVE